MIMRITLDIKFRADSEEDAVSLKKALYGPAKDRAEIDGRYIFFHSETTSEEELDEMQYYVDELPHHLAEKNEICFEYDGNLDMFDDFVQIQTEYRNGKYRYQSVEEEAYYIGEKKDGRIRLRGADEDEYALFFD